MKKRFLFTATALSLLILAAPLTVSAAALDPASPEYSTAPVTDEDGWTNDITYNFPGGTVDTSMQDTLMMVDGEFIPYAVEIRDDRSLVPTRFVTEAFGASVSWDGATQTVNVSNGDVTAVLTIGKQTAVVTKNGATENYDLLTPAILIDNYAYVPVRALAEIFGKSVGYEPGGSDFMYYNPFVWIDEPQSDWSPDISVIQANCTSALNLMKAEAAAGTSDALAQPNAEQIFAEIQQKIDDMQVTGYIGRYAVVDGPYPILVTQDGTVYFHYTGFRLGSIYKADFSDPLTFLSDYFAG